MVAGRGRQQARVTPAPSGAGLLRNSRTCFHAQRTNARMRCLTSTMILRLIPIVLLCACAAQAPLPTAERPELAQAALPYAQPLRDVGITRVISPGNGAMVQLETLSGPVYVRYPQDPRPRLLYWMSRRMGSLRPPHRSIARVMCRCWRRFCPQPSARPRPTTSCSGCAQIPGTE